MLYEVFSTMRKSGEPALQREVDNPPNSEILKLQVCCCQATVRH